MELAEPKETLLRYLNVARESLLWKLDGLSDYDLRRPMTPTGTNLIGLVKHLASVESEYLGDCFGRPSGEDLPWFADDAAPNADMWLTANESCSDILALYHRVADHSKATIDSLGLDAIGTVPWWPEDRQQVTLHRILVHVTTETHRHAGHADIVRELIDGEVGMRSDALNMAPGDDDFWPPFLEQVQAAAEEVRDRPNGGSSVG